MLEEFRKLSEIRKQNSSTSKEEEELDETESIKIFKLSEFIRETEEKNY